MKTQVSRPDDLTDVAGLLPPVVQTLVIVIGLRATMELVRQAGGTTVAIPKRESRQGEAQFEAIAEMIGADAAVALTRHFGGEPLYVPQCRTALAEFEYRKIREAFDKLTRDTSSTRAVAILAVRHGYSDRHIWNILKMPDRVEPAEGAVRAAGQLGLF